MTGPESKEADAFTPWNKFYETLLGLFSKRLKKQEVHQNVFPTFAIIPSGGRDSSLRYSFRRNQKEIEEGIQNKYTLKVEVVQPSRKVANSISLADIGIARAASDKRYEVVLEEIIGENGSYLSSVSLLVNNYDEKEGKTVKAAPIVLHPVPSDKPAAPQEVIGGIFDTVSLALSGKRVN